MIKKLDISLWGREFSLPVDYDCYEDEQPTQEQLDSLASFSTKKDLIEKAGKEVEKYCQAEVSKDKEIENKEDVFSYVTPHYIYVTHDGIHPCLAIMCKYRYDPEHGIAIVFRADGKVIIGMQDIIL